MRLLRWLSLVGTVVGMSGLLFVSVAQAAEVDLFARLAGNASFPKATGTSSYERDSGGRDVEVTVRGIPGMAGRSVTFYVSGLKIGSARVSSTGVVHIERDTEHGQFVPLASAGSTVRVRTSTGKLIAGGTYVRVPDTD